MKTQWPEVKGLTEKVAELEKLYDGLEATTRKLRKSAAMGNGSGALRWINGIPFVSDDAAKALVTDFVLDVSQLGGNGLARLFPDETKRAYMLSQAKSFAGISQRAGGALTSTDIPLPTIYMPQVIELVFAYGQARKFGTVFPLGAGTVKLPAYGWRRFLRLPGRWHWWRSQNVPQKECKAVLVTFTANRNGRPIRIPTEIEDDTFIQLGQFLARYIARQFAQMEDKTMFLADGSGTYANMQVLPRIARTIPRTCLFKPAAGNTRLSQFERGVTSVPCER